MSIASENVTVMLSVIDTKLWLSDVVETEDTVGSVLVLSVVNPLDVSYSLLIALPAVSFTPVVTLVK